MNALITVLEINTEQIRALSANVLTEKSGVQNLRFVCKNVETIKGEILALKNVPA